MALDWLKTHLDKMTMGPVSPAAPSLKLDFGHEVFVLVGSSWGRFQWREIFEHSRKVFPLKLAFFLRVDEKTRIVSYVQLFLFVKGHV